MPPSSLPSGVVAVALGRIVNEGHVDDTPVHIPFVHSAAGIFHYGRGIFDIASQGFRTPCECAAPAEDTFRDVLCAEELTYEEITGSKSSYPEYGCIF